MRKVAIVSFAQSRHIARYQGNEIELLLPVVQQAVRDSGLARSEIGITTASSNDFLAGQAFAFVRALDAIGAYPVIDDSHLDMDGAWAMYEAWVRLQVGDVDSALVYALGKTSSGKLHEIRPLELDPYYLAPLMPDPDSMAALQACRVLETGMCSEQQLAAITARNLRSAANNDCSLRKDANAKVEQLLQANYYRHPLRGLDCPPVTDGAAALVLATEELALRCCPNPVWIKGIDHRIEPHSLGIRELSDSRSTKIAAHHLGLQPDLIDIAELHTQYPHEEVILKQALGLPERTLINLSGGPQTANPLMATGLIRIGEVVQAIRKGKGKQGLAHATAGPCLQQNLLAWLEGMLWQNDAPLWELVKANMPKSDIAAWPNWCGKQQTAHWWMLS
jgi:acetyl-CoA acetyltransferase